MPKIYAGTTIGNGHYLREWRQGINYLEPSVVAVSVDDSRHSELSDGLDCELLHYDTSESWRNYEARHEGWRSDYSIGLGIRNLIGSFLKSDCGRFVCVDSDVILDKGVGRKIRDLEYDYLQLGVPAAIRERLGLVYLHWRSTNFAITRELAARLYPLLDYNPGNSYPVDLKLHAAIRSLAPPSAIRAKSRHLVHYLNSKGRTRRVSTLEAQLRSLYARPFMFFYGRINPLSYPANY